MTKTGANSRVQEEVIKNICWDQFNIEKQGQQMPLPKIMKNHY
ncbi:hypothetical protein SD457_06395 [Coprobacillaceae bacterium CR2/5/TPMF4]|nr:hypothetical protein SD457_06395 [Coprobacillaceae bacterium CR2/5/TPMF4]